MTELKCDGSSQCRASVHILGCFAGPRESSVENREPLTDAEISRLLAGLEGDEKAYLREIGDSGDIGEELLRALLELRQRRARDHAVGVPRELSNRKRRKIIRDWQRPQ